MTKINKVRSLIRTIPDFPKKGILFRDITPLLSDAKAFRYCIDHFKKLTRKKIDCIVSVESRGFIFGSALAYALGVGFVLVRKEGKLPHRKISASYALEYGKACIEMHADAIRAGSRVIVIDDVLATGGTVDATVNLIEKLGGNVEALYFLIELKALKGRHKLSNHKIHSLVSY